MRRAGAPKWYLIKVVDQNRFYGATAATKYRTSSYFCTSIYLLDPYIIGVRENYRRAEKFLWVAIGDKGLMMTKALNNHIKMC